MPSSSKYINDVRVIAAAVIFGSVSIATADPPANPIGTEPERPLEENRRSPALSNTPKGGTLPGGTVPGGTLPGGTVPGGTVPGGTLPGGTVPGGTLPGGTLPGGTVPGGTLPSSTVPGGTLP